MAGGSVAVAAAAADRTRVAGELEDVELRLDILRGRVVETEARESGLEEEVDRLSDGIGRCVSRIDLRVQVNNRLAQDLKRATLTSLSELDPYVARVEHLHRLSRQDLRACQQAIG